MFFLRAGRGGAGLRRWLEDEGQKLRRRVPAVVNAGARAARRRQRRTEYPRTQSSGVGETFGWDYRVVLMPQTVTYADEAASSLNWRQRRTRRCSAGRYAPASCSTSTRAAGRFLSSGAGARRRLRVDVRRAASNRKGSSASRGLMRTAQTVDRPRWRRAADVRICGRIRRARAATPRPLARRGPLRPRRPAGRAPPPRRAPRGQPCVPPRRSSRPTPRRPPCAARGPVRRGPAVCTGASRFVERVRGGGCGRKARRRRCWAAPRLWVNVVLVHRIRDCRLGGPPLREYHGLLGLPSFSTRLE